MKRVHNFSAGPSVLPEAVLRRAADEMLDYQGSGQSVMEMSHRSKTFDAIIKNTEALLRELMEIPDNYKSFVFTRRRICTQFSMIPMNLMTKKAKLTLSLQVNGLTKAEKEASCVMPKQILLLPPKTKLSPIFQI